MYGDTYSLAIRNPKYEIDMWNYLSPFHEDSWIGICALIGISSICLTFACHLAVGECKHGILMTYSFTRYNIQTDNNRHQFTMLNSVAFSFGGILFVGYEE